MRTKKQEKQTIEQTNNNNDNLFLQNGDINIEQLLKGLSDNTPEPKTKKTKTKTKTTKTKTTKKQTIEQNSIEQTIKQLIENNNKQNKIIEQLQNTIIELKQNIEQNKNNIEQTNIDFEQHRYYEHEQNDIHDNDILYKTIFGGKQLIYNKIEDITQNLHEQIFFDTKQQTEQNYKNSILYRITNLQNKVIEQNNTINTLITANNRMYDYTSILQNRIKQLQNKQTIEQNNSIEQNTIEQNTIEQTIEYNYKNSKIVYKYLIVMLFTLIFGVITNSIKYIIQLFNNSKNYIFNTVLNIVNSIKNSIEQYKLKQKYKKMNKYSKLIQQYYSKINELNTIQ